MASNALEIDNIRMREDGEICLPTDDDDVGDVHEIELHANIECYYSKMKHSLMPCKMDQKLLLSLIAKLLESSRNAEPTEVNESLARKDKFMWCDESNEFKDGETVDVYETRSVYLHTLHTVRA